MPKKSSKNLKFTEEDLAYMIGMREIIYPHMKYPQDIFRKLLADWIDHNPDVHKLIMEKLNPKK